MLETGKIRGKMGNLAEAVDLVYKTAQYGRSRIYGGFPTYQFLVCVAALNHVTTNVHSSVYTHLTNTDQPLPLPTAESALDYHAGLCGHSALAYAHILRPFNITTRSVQFYWHTGFGDRNHIAVEAYHDGQWRYYDPTWGAFYHRNGQVMSINDARTGQGRLLRHQTLLNALISDWGDLDPLTHPDTRVELDQQPFFAEPDPGLPPDLCWAATL